jgi:hypothetical protein
LSNHPFVDRGFESRQGVKFLLGLYVNICNAVLCNLIGIVVEGMKTMLQIMERFYVSPFFVQALSNRSWMMLRNWPSPIFHMQNPPSTVRHHTEAAAADDSPAVISRPPPKKNSFVMFSCHTTADVICM